MSLDRQYDYFSTLRSRLSYITFAIQSTTHHGVLWFKQWESAVHRNKRLSEEVALLRENQLRLNANLQKLGILKAENERLRAMLSATPMNREDLLVADVLQIASDPFVHQITIDKGRAFGIFTGQPVIDDQGVVGFIAQVDQFSARVLLATDASCAIPVKNLRNGVRAIAMGKGMNHLMALQHVPVTVDFQEGDKLVTSGLGDQYPPGYLVGVVSNIDRDPGAAFSMVLVSPASRLEGNRQVLLLNPNKSKKVIQ